MNRICSLLCAIGTIGCASEASRNETLSATLGEAGKSDHSSTVAFSDAVEWHYVDQIGVDRRDPADPEREEMVEGYLHVEFVGEPLPIAHGRSVIQPSLVQMSIPNFRNPEQLDERTFYVLYETFDRGQTYGVVPFGDGSVIDADHARAAEYLDAAYDFDTQRGRQTSGGLRPGESVNVDLVTGDDGELGPKQFFGINGCMEYEFARHCVRIQL